MTAIAAATSRIDTYLNGLHGPAATMRDVRALTDANTRAVAAERAAVAHITGSGSSAASIATVEPKLRATTGKAIELAAQADLPNVCAPAP